MVGAAPVVSQSVMELQPREQYLAGYLSLALADCAAARPFQPILHIANFLEQLDEEIFPETDVNVGDENDTSDSSDSTDYLLFVTSSKFRKYVGPALQSALTECAATKPDNPIQFIATALEKYSARLQTISRH